MNNFIETSLDTVLPELKFDNVAFADVIDFFRDVTGANIFVNWRVLEGVGIDKAMQVSARLRDVTFKKALTTVLSDVSGGTVAITYKCDEGVIEISTEEDLASVETDFQIFPELQPLLERFRLDHPDARGCAFVMMRFDTSPAHDAIFVAVSDTLARLGIRALRADSKTYSEEMLMNIRTYMHGCGFGVAIFERLNTDDFNPNVSLEVGYMLAQGKPVCLLKDKTLRSLHTDLVGRLYEPFDSHDPGNSIPRVLEKWLRDREIV